MTPTSDLADELVFRQTLDRPFDLAAVADAEFVLLAAPADAWRQRRALARRFGARTLPKGLRQVQTRSRLLYALTRDQACVHDGWLSVSRCDAYPIAAGEVVIGPIATTSDMRGQGLASYGLQEAMNAMFRRGLTSSTSMRRQRIS